MITIQELSLLDIAAKSTLSDINTEWIYRSIDYAIQKKYREIMNKFWLDIDSLTGKELDYLLWEYHVDYIGENTTEEKKRDLIKKSITAHFNKGTLGSVKAICNILFGNAEIQEWFEYAGRPGYFKIKTTGDLTSQNDFEKVLAVVNEYKNVRSWLETLRFLRQEETKLYFGTYKKHKLKYNLGSTDVNMPNKTLNTKFGIVHRTRYLTGGRNGKI